MNAKTLSSLGVPPDEPTRLGLDFVARYCREGGGPARLTDEISAMVANSRSFSWRTIHRMGNTPHGLIATVDSDETVETRDSALYRMLEKLPHVIGQALKGKGPGLDKTVYFGESIDSAPETITVKSSAFADGGTIPVRFTDDGEKVSPPLAWEGVPDGSRSLVLVIEDADSPTPAPIVHALVFDLPPTDGQLTEGALKSPGSEGETHSLGKNTFLKKAYLPPDPPPGGGAHRYLFQVYALDRTHGLIDGAGRGAVKDALSGHVLARGSMLGTYERP